MLLAYVATSVAHTTAVPRVIEDVPPTHTNVRIVLPEDTAVTYDEHVVGVFACSKRVASVVWRAPNELVVVVYHDALPRREFVMPTLRPRVRPLDMASVRADEAPTILAIEHLVTSDVPLLPSDLVTWLQTNDDDLEPTTSSSTLATDTDSDSDEESSSASAIVRLPGCTCYSLCFAGLPHVSGALMKHVKDTYPLVDTMHTQRVGVRPTFVVGLRSATCTASHASRGRPHKRRRRDADRRHE